MGIYWGACNYFPLEVPTYQRIPVNYIYNGALNSGVNNYNLDTYGNLTYDQSVLSLTWANNSLNFLASNMAGSAVTNILFELPVDVNYEAITFKILKSSGTGYFGAKLIWGDSLIDLTLNTANPTCIIDVRGLPVPAQIGIQLYNDSQYAGARVMNFSEISFS